MPQLKAQIDTTWQLNEIIAQRILDILPEDGPSVFIVDRTGRRWPAQTHIHHDFPLDRTEFTRLCDRIDDGVEPVVIQKPKACIVACQLAAEDTNFGYLLVVLPGYTLKTALANTALIEMLLNQTTLIAGLIEKNHRLWRPTIPSIAL